MTVFTTISRRTLLASGAAAGILALAMPVLAQETPKRGGTVIAATDIQPRSLDPLLGQIGRSDRYSTAHMFDALVSVDASGSVHPSLAKSWDYVDGGRGLVFTLRDDVTFHDGTAFDAEAVKFNIDRALDTSLGSLITAQLAGIQSVDVLDAHRVRLNLSEPNAAILALMGMQAGMISSPTAVRASSTEDYGLKPVGTGPFKFKEWVIDSHVDMERNETYWRKDASGAALPYLDNVRIRFITNPAVKVVELMAGSIHVAENVPSRNFAEIEANPALQLVGVPIGVMQQLSFNTKRKPMNDARVRKAFSHAIDRDFLAELIAEGYGSAARGGVAPRGWDFDPERPAGDAYDPAESRRLLAEAGYPDGIDISMLMIQRDPDTQITQVIQQQALDAGFRVEINAPDRSSVTAVRLAGEWDVYLTRSNMPLADPVQYYDFAIGRNGQNLSSINDEALFAEIDAARTSTDRDQRREHYLRVQEMIADKTYYTYLFFRESRDAASANLKNLEVDVSGVWFLGDAWLD